MGQLRDRALVRLVIRVLVEALMQLRKTDQGQGKQKQQNHAGGNNPDGPFSVTKRCSYQGHLFELTKSAS
jgi:hypothetical protein